MALKEKETYARLSTARHRFHKPPPLSLSMSYRVIGPKRQLTGPVLPSGEHPPSWFPSRKSESVQVEEAWEVSGPTRVPERPAISTAAATTQPLGGSCQPKRKWLSREPMPKPWRGLCRPHAFTLGNTNAAGAPETAPASWKLAAPPPAGAGGADGASVWRFLLLPEVTSRREP